jgi:hypothetical protein
MPFAFRLEIIDAVIKMGLFKITPGSAKLVQTASNPKRYMSSPKVFQIARLARGICDSFRLYITNSRVGRIH